MDNIKMFDYLYTEAKFTFNESGQTGEKTIFGGIVSIFTILVSLGCTGYFTYRLFNKDDSSIILSSEIDPYVNITYQPCIITSLLRIAYYSHLVLPSLKQQAF